jgi:hypothetical protein
MTRKMRREENANQQKSESTQTKEFTSSSSRNSKRLVSISLDPPCPLSSSVIAFLNHCSISSLRNLAAQLVSLNLSYCSERDIDLLHEISLRTPCLRSLAIEHHKFRFDEDRDLSRHALTLLQQSIARLHSLTSIFTVASAHYIREPQAVVEGLAALPPESIRNLLSITIHGYTPYPKDVLLDMIMKHRPILHVLDIGTCDRDCSSLLESIQAAAKEERRKGSGQLLLYKCSIH